MLLSRLTCSDAPGDRSWRTEEIFANRFRENWPPDLHKPVKKAVGNLYLSYVKQ